MQTRGGGQKANIFRRHNLLMGPSAPSLSCCLPHELGMIASRVESGEGEKVSFRPKLVRHLPARRRTSFVVGGGVRVRRGGEARRGLSRMMTSSDQSILWFSQSRLIPLALQAFENPLHFIADVLKV